MGSDLVYVVLHRALWAHIKDFGVTLSRMHSKSCFSCLLLATKHRFKSDRFIFLYLVGLPFPRFPEIVVIFASFFFNNYQDQERDPNKEISVRFWDIFSWVMTPALQSCTVRADIFTWTLISFSRKGTRIKWGVSSMSLLTSIDFRWPLSSIQDKIQGWFF